MGDKGGRNTTATAQGQCIVLILVGIDVFVSKIGGEFGLIVGRDGVVVMRHGDHNEQNDEGGQQKEAIQNDNGANTKRGRRTAATTSFIRRFRKRTKRGGGR